MSENSILKTVRKACGLDIDDDSFDGDLLLHINNALSILNQVGAGKTLEVDSEAQTWDEFKDPEQVHGNEIFPMCKQYVHVKTKLLFDPPPPSNVQYFSAAIEEQLWRIRESYNLDKKGGLFKWRIS